VDLADAGGYLGAVKTWLAACLAGLALVGARLARQAAADLAPKEQTEAPYAPSPEAAPFVWLGHRELAADVSWVRLLSYFGGETSSANGIADVVEAIVALDPRFRRAYEYGARAITMASEGVDNAALERALAVLDRGMHEFSDDWRMPELASQIYTQDLVTSDPAQRRAWDEKAALLIEAAVRKPGAPASEATWAATLRTHLGQHELAVKNLREMILITTDDDARKRLIDKLAALEDADQDAIASEVLASRKRFDSAWLVDRPALPPTMYVLLGQRLPPWFDLGDLATGGRDLAVGQERDELPADDAP
jgi:hypothetical protein